MKTLKEFIIEYNSKKGYGLDRDSLYETFEEWFNVVDQSEPDHHRWYTLYDIVREVEIDGVKRYFSDTEWDIHGEEASREDCGFEVPDLDDLEEVYPKEVKTITYVTKNKL